MLMTQAQPTMPALTDAMRAVLRNEREVYESEDALYAALCDAAGAQPVVNQQMTTDTALADTQRQIIEAAERRGYERAEAENVGYRTDAERYRWLKENIELGYELPGGYYIPDEDTDTWDKTIDAARAAKGEA